LTAFANYQYLELSDAYNKKRYENYHRETFDFSQEGLWKQSNLG